MTTESSQCIVGSWGAKKAYTESLIHIHVDDLEQEENRKRRRRTEKYSLLPIRMIHQRKIWFQHYFILRHSFEIGGTHTREKEWSKIRESTECVWLSVFSVATQFHHPYFLFKFFAPNERTKKLILLLLLLSGFRHFKRIRFHSESAPANWLNWNWDSFKTNYSKCDSD